MDNLVKTDNNVIKKNEKLEKNVDTNGENSKSKEKFNFKSLFHGKNLAIAILSFILFCFICTMPSDNITELKKTIEILNTKIAEQEQQIKDNEEKINKLQTENDDLKKDNDNLKSSVNSTVENTSNSNTILSNEATTQMVWVGNTGTKYHRQSCRTLRGGGHQISYQQAISEGRQPCEICNP